ncbi:hypothetical protein [Flavivirga rizhaonensis]|uniref:Uncharacterized protein n=1 Tax=Flavivirga rizhaonensis TaxID=2559571 RepID=A0A4S1DTB7_9FLAO|nr:hypothetical protein [Flavivirga rizhaonensis]TGV01179.1 hypothetical protein EM932_16195 [Flavivirga rizhaonensis]
MKLNEADKKIIRLKNFESSLLQLRQSIRSIKYDFKRNIKHASFDDKLKKTYRKKLEEYTVKELNYLRNMIDNY